MGTVCLPASSVEEETEARRGSGEQEGGGSLGIPVWLLFPGSSELATSRSLVMAGAEGASPIHTVRLGPPVPSPPPANDNDITLTTSNTAYHC